MKRTVVFLAVLTLPVLITAGFLVARGNGQKSEDNAVSTIQSPGPGQIFMLADRDEPGVLTVKKGEEVTFINKDTDDHWPASNDHPTHQIYSEFDPKRPISPGSSWSFVFEHEGQWKFHDHLFPFIGGTVIVNP